MPRRSLKRADLLRALSASVAFGVAPSVAEAASEPATSLTPSEALTKLLKGNDRYLKDEAVNCNQNYNRRAEVAAAQAPFAIVLGCADSRVPPEVIFDRRLGELFVVRVAGNIPDDIGIGSIEYAIEHFHSPLLLVLGHEKCGAVSATVNAVRAGTHVPGFVGRIVAAITPAAERALGEPGDAFANAVAANVHDVVAALQARSIVVAEAAAAGKLHVAGAVYDLRDGRVRLLS